MNLFYLKRSKEELRIAKEFLNNLNDDTIFKLITHLTKGMEFIVDFINNAHVEFAYNLNSLKSRVENVIGEEFVDTYFYLNNLKNKNIKVLNNKNILISGKRVEHVNQSHFKEITFKIINYFNNLYDKTESGKVWV